MTPDELRRECGIVMAAIKAQIEGGIAPAPVFRFHWPISVVPRSPVVTPGEWSQMPFDLGPLLDDGRAKTILFGMFRDVVQRTGADGAIFATDAWRGVITPEGMKHQPGEPNGDWAREVDKGFDRLVKLGWATREECIIITGQSDTHVVVMSHGYRGQGARTQWLGELDVHVIPQSQFGGRQKMFGDLRRENLGEPPEGSHADRHNRGKA